MIRVLEYPENIRQKWGMYIDSPSTMLREAIDNSTDEVLSCKTCNLIIIDTNFGGYNMVADQGRGIPIFMSPDKPGRTQADVAVSTLHAGSKFVNTDSKIGTYGIGVSATNALSSDFWVLSKITEENYNKSLSVVSQFYGSLGPRSKKEIFYYAYYQKGYKISEGAAKKSDLERMMGCPELPKEMSTIILFKVDPEIFPSSKAEIPVGNLENFLFIQEKFYRRKLTIVANGALLTAGNIKPYAYEILRTITPADTSKNPYIGVYVTFEVDPGLSPKKCTGSVNGLVVDNGVHIQYVEKCFEDALREEYKIKHKTIFPGLKMWVIVLVEDPVYDSQIKSRLRGISKVKPTDFQEITKDFLKIFRKNEDYWTKHVTKLNALAESYKSIGAVEKAQKMIDSATGNQSYRSKQEYVEGFADATSGNRWDCELFLCFTGDTKVLLASTGETPTMEELVKMYEEGNFRSYPKTITVDDDRFLYDHDEKIIAAKKIKDVTKLVKITLNNGKTIKCTPDHEFMLSAGGFKQAQDLTPEDNLMSFEYEYHGENPNYIYYIREVHKEKRFFYAEKVEFLDVEPTPVYCVEVDAKNHTFALEAGVIVKNCEGLSAAGGLKAGRKSTEYHAVLPLRGKILNVKDSTVDEALANKEIFTMLKSIGLGIDINNVTTGCATPEEAYQKIRRYSRFGKIVLSTDSDSDGSHIQILILYLIAKYARFLIDFGLVYIAMSPLYEQDGKYFFQNDPLQPGTTFPVGLNISKHFRRWKGFFMKALVYRNIYLKSH